MGHIKPFADGGGLCSPGRWIPQRRKLATGRLSELRGRLQDVFLRSCVTPTGDHCTPFQMIDAMASGAYQENPSNEELMVEAREVIAWLLDIPQDHRTCAQGQTFFLGLIAALLKEAGDPDWRFYLEVGDGVPLGVDGSLPRVPAVFEEKLRWKLDDAVGFACRKQVITPAYKSTWLK